MANFPRSSDDAELDALFVHDLRSPIAAISANFGFLKTTPSVAGDESALEALQDAESATLILQHIVDNLAVLSALESAPSELAPEVVNLPETVLSCLERMGPITAASEIKVVAAIEPGAPGPRVLVVPRLLRAAIDNLVQTALRHTPRREHVRVSVHVEGTQAVLEVRDGGAPVPPRLGADLFSRQGQLLAKREPTSRYGRGLGLLVAGLAVRACNGTIQAVELEGRNAFRASFQIV